MYHVPVSQQVCTGEFGVVFRSHSFGFMFIFRHNGAGTTLLLLLLGHVVYVLRIHAVCTYSCLLVGKLLPMTSGDVYFAVSSSMPSLPAPGDFSYENKIWWIANCSREVVQFVGQFARESSATGRTGDGVNASKHHNIQTARLNNTYEKEGCLCG